MEKSTIALFFLVSFTIISACTIFFTGTFEAALFFSCIAGVALSGVVFTLMFDDSSIRAFVAAVTAGVIVFVVVLTVSVYRNEERFKLKKLKTSSALRSGCFLFP